MTDFTGQYLGRYYLSERLGEGGMAVVYKAYDTRLERDVAVKIIRSGAFPAEALDEVSKRFEREAKALAKLSHPNIVKVHDYGEHEGSPYLVMEYLPGGTLKKMLGRPIPWNEALRLLLPAARGVAYAHQRGILHRDIKPANILITEHGEPMLSDFGIAKLFEADQSTQLTGTGMMIGTPEYMAPEQWMGQTTQQSDLYSLGIVLYEMVAGRKPYIADTPASILLKQATEPLPPPRKFTAGIPESLELLLIKALAREPVDRFVDVNALIQAMEALLISAPTLQFPPADQDSVLRESATPVASGTVRETIPPLGESGSSISRGNTVPPTTGQTSSARSRRVSPVGAFAMFGGVGLIAMLGIGIIILILLPSIFPQTLNPEPSATIYRVTPTDSAASLIVGETPRPELGFTIVEPQEALNISATVQALEDVALESYSEADSNRVNATLIFTINSTPDVPLLWYWGWCAADEQTLEQNMTQINFVIEADGYVIPHDQLAKETYDMDSSEAQYEGWKCEGFLAVLRDWKPGTYNLVETITFLSPIHDGKDAFEAGRMLRRYTVNISE